MTTDSSHKACAYPWQQLIVDLTGEVVPCCFWSGYGNSGKPLGNTNEQSLDEIWNGEAYRELRRANASGDLKGHPCHECVAWQWAGDTYPRFSWPGTFGPETGHCYTVPIPERFLRETAEAAEPVLLLEDGVALPSPDATHADIRERGEGRYSVWGETLYMSSSDNSDPRTNGRSYELGCGECIAGLGSLVTDCESGKNLLTAHEEYTSGTEVMTAKPSMISFISTSDCNIECPACSQNTVRLLKVQHRERTELDVLEHVPYLQQLVWHGGEPYIIKRFREFIDGFRTEDNPNLAFGFTSNGTLLSAAELDKLDKFPRINASVSIDSFVPETFERIRAGARFDAVLANVLRAMERYDASRFVLSVGMIITKDNFRELPRNLAFAIEHDIGLNLSPVVVYPVHERIDVFRDFHSETDGWREALDEAEAIVRKARVAGARALRRIDPSGMLGTLRQTLDAAAARYADVIPVTVVLTDPHGALGRMRRPGLVVWRDKTNEMLSFIAFDGPGEYQFMLPRSALGGPHEIVWGVLHDLNEPMGLVERDYLCSRDCRPLGEAGWTMLPTEMHIELSAFTPVPRPRNAEVMNRGLPRPDALHVLDTQQMFAAYHVLAEAEASGGAGLAAELSSEESLRRRALDARLERYRAFQSLVT